MPDDAPCTISIDAGFDESGVWVIDTRISWRDGPSPPGSVLLGAERGAMLTAIDAEARRGRIDRKSTRLNSSHGYISYAVFCLKKKKKYEQTPTAKCKQ